MTTSSYAKASIEESGPALETEQGLSEHSSQQVASLSYWPVDRIPGTPKTNRTYSHVYMNVMKRREGMKPV